MRNNYTIRINSLKRLRNSVYGNPRWEITFTETVKVPNKLYYRITRTGKTRANSSLGYFIYSGLENKKVKDIKYHFTKNNNIIIDEVIL